MKFKNNQSLEEKNFIFDPKHPPEFGCTAYHPPLHIIIDNTSHFILGGTCIEPHHMDADVYLSLDQFATTFEWEQPWQESLRHHVRFFIEDNDVPRNIKNFNAALNYIREQLVLNKKVHVGCISGHGRTGLFLAALSQICMANTLREKKQSAIDYVRDNYCAFSVENIKQVLFLHVYYGVALPQREKEYLCVYLNDFKQDTGKTFSFIVKKHGFEKAWDYNRLTGKSGYELY